MTTTRVRADDERTRTTSMVAPQRQVSSEDSHDLCQH